MIRSRLFRTKNHSFCFSSVMAAVPPRGAVIKAYSLMTADDEPGRDPKGWQFQGSSDGATWTTLDERSRQSFPFHNYEMEYFISKPGAYRYYRLNVPADNGARTIQIGDIALLTDEKLRNAKTQPLVLSGANNASDREQAFASHHVAGN